MGCHFCLSAASVSIILAFTALSGVAQKTSPDPAIKAMVKEVSAAKIETTVRTLASFGTRNTLSSQTDPMRGVGAARDWIYAEFGRISANCGGCLTVEKQTFLQPKA